MSLFKRIFGRGVAASTPSWKMNSGLDPTTVLFSPDGLNIAYRVKDAKGQHVEVNGRFFLRWDAVSGITFSPDSSQVAYAAQEGDGWYVVFDQKYYGPFVDIGKTSPVISLSSTRIAYTAKTDRGWCAFMDSEIIGGPYEGFGPGGMVFSSDSSCVGYVIRRNGKWSAVVDGVEQEPYYSIYQRSQKFRPGSRDFAYFAVSSESAKPGKLKGAVILAGKPLNWWEWDEKDVNVKRSGFLGELFFSPDGQRLAYGVIQNGKYLVCIDGIEGRSYGGMIGGFHPKQKTAMELESAKASWSSGSISFSPDSQRYAYAAFDDLRNKAVLILDGDEVALHDGINDSPVVFSPDSHRFAYSAAESKTQFLVLNGIPLREFYGISEIPAKFSPDSQHVAYISIEEHGSYQLNIDAEYLALPGTLIYGTRFVWKDNQMAQVLILDGDQIKPVKFTVER